MKFEEFKGSPNRERKNEARVTLNHRGVVQMNRQAFEAFGSPAAVKLFFEEQELVIALKPSDVRHRNAFRLKLKGSGNTRIIHTLPFCRHNKIRVERTVLFNEVDIDNEGTMFLSLKDITRIGRRWE
jgi:hypothetical protein